MFAATKKAQNPVASNALEEQSNDLPVSDINKRPTDINLFLWRQERSVMRSYIDYMTLITYSIQDTDGPLLTEILSSGNGNKVVIISEIAFGVLELDKSQRNHQK